MTGFLNINFDFCSEIPEGRDPDRYSPTLRKYHKILWSKCLPNGDIFELVDSYPKAYLKYNSCLGEFMLNSDAITHSYRNTKRMAHIISQIPIEMVNHLYSCGGTIGSYILFPKNKIKGQQSINQVRGCHRKIADRFDLSLECIRLFYSNMENPLTSVLQRHSDFFGLFRDFKGYVDFFLLQDLVEEDYSAIKYFLQHRSFEESPFPKNVEAYLEYRENTLRFIKARGQRMLNSVSESMLASHTPNIACT